MSKESILEFPCRYPVKVMGKDTDEFRRSSLAIIEQRVGKVAPADIQERSSREGNFVAVTYELSVGSRKQLDELYRALSGHKDVLVVL